ncbi:MAG: sigma-70 family RNA polymerase sigma factor [Phycisphaerales bacterium]
MEDTWLVFQSRRGSREALTRIYEKYKADLLLLAMGLLNDKAAAEDIVHDVFLSFVRSLDRFRLTGSLKGFLLTCTANHARNWNKAQRVRLRPVGDEGGHGPSNADGRSVAQEPLECVVCNEELELLAKALAELPFEQREIVMLHLHGQMTFQAIAKAMQIPANTVKSRYRFGIDKLRVTLNGEVTECNQQTT